MRLRYVTDTPEAAQRVRQLLAEPILGLDIETTGLCPYLDTIRLVSVATLDGKVAVFDMVTVDWSALRALSQRPWAVFNGNFEYRHLIKHMTVPPLHDVQLLDRIVSHKMHRKLSDVVHDQLGIALDKTEQQSDWATAALSESQIEYAALDALTTVRCAEPLLHTVNKKGQRPLYDLWRGALPVLARLELHGQGFNFEQHSAMISAWEKEKQRLYCDLVNYLGPGVNPNSGAQVGTWLQGRLPAEVIAKWPKTNTGKLKTDADTLSLFSDNAVIQPLLRFKKITKMLSTYGANYAAHRHPQTGRLHPSFSLGQTKSSRICASRPNVQNPPRSAEFRALWIPSAGNVFIGADYSQIELRVAALLARDTAMLTAYGKGADLHTVTAAAIAGVAADQVTKEQRSAAKAVNFGNLYGQGAKGLAQTAKLTYGVDMTHTAAQAALDAFHNAYPQLSAWKRQQIALAQHYRRVTTRMGLIRDFEVQGEGYLKGEACNIPIQGSAAEILLATLRRLPGDLVGLDARLYHNVHDELIIECAADQAEPCARALADSMIEGFLEVFPEGEALTHDLIDVSIGNNWAEVH